MNWKDALILSFGLLGAGFFVGEGIVSHKKLDQVVNVRGLDERIVDSNEASWQISFVANGQNLNDINKQITSAQDEVKKFIIQYGLSEKDLLIGPASLTDNHANNYSTVKNPYRYTARAQLTVASTEVDKLFKASTKSDELLKYGIQIENQTMKYFFTQLNSVKPEILKNATANAFEAAQSFAKDSGSTLGKIKTASQGLFTIESPYNDWDVQSSRQKKVRVVTQVSYFIE